MHFSQDYLKRKICSSKSTYTHYKTEHINLILEILSWLPFSFRIDFLLVLIFKAYSGQAPSYILEGLADYVPNRSLRWSNARLLNIPKIKSKKYVNVAFYFYAPKIWNNLSLTIFQAPSLSIKKSSSKHIYFFNFS